MDQDGAEEQLMEGSQDRARGADGHPGASAVEEPLAKAGRLFVEMAEQVAQRRARAPGLTLGADLEAPASARFPPVIQSGTLSDVERTLETVFGALSAVNERLASLERLVLTGDGDGTEPEFDQSSYREWSSRWSFPFDDPKRRLEIEAASDGLPVLGLIPKVDSWKDRTVALVGAGTWEERLAAEAYRALCSNVELLRRDQQARSIQVTSPLQGDGKTTTAAILAVLLAQAGHRVIAMCCDLRRPRLHEFFGLPNATGLTSVLQRSAPLQGVVQEVPGVLNLKVVTSGPVAVSSPDLLRSPRLAEVISVLQEECDVMLIDCPPVLPVTDAATVSQRVQGTVIVVNTGLSSRHDLQRALEILREVEAPLLGTVVNAIPRKIGGYTADDGLPYEPRSEAGSDTSPAAGPTSASEEELGDVVGRERASGGVGAPELGSRSPVEAVSRARRIWTRAHGPDRRG